MDKSPVWAVSVKNLSKNLGYSDRNNKEVRARLCLTAKKCRRKRKPFVSASAKPSSRALHKKKNQKPVPLHCQEMDG